MITNSNYSQEKITNMTKKKILVFTGAGCSAESGIKTFRDCADGLWYNFNVEDVATPAGWKRDPQKVMDFYNQRKNDLKNVVPNPAHLAIASLENDYDVCVVTQNVDDLHERAGSSRVIHLHGTLTLLKGERGGDTRFPYIDDLKIGDSDESGNQLRPDIVWFGENLNRSDMALTQMFAEEADICLVVGTSMQVSPANGIPWLTPELTPVYYVDPGEIDFHVPKLRKKTGLFQHIKEKASIGVNLAIEELKSLQK